MRTKPELRCYATDNNINPITTWDPRGSQAARGKSEHSLCVRIQLWIRLKQPVILSRWQPPRIQWFGHHRWRYKLQLNYMVYQYTCSHPMYLVLGTTGIATVREHLLHLNLSTTTLN